MIGPLELFTTLSSSDRAGVGGGPSCCAALAGHAPEDPVKNAPTPAARATLPISRRLSFNGASGPGGAGAHVPHPVELQPPHVPPALPITSSDFAISILLSRKALSF